jgi:hypothetical protein
MKKTPHEEAMERLAKRITLANQLDSAMPNQPTSSDDEDTPKPRSKR